MIRTTGILVARGFAMAFSIILGIAAGEAVVNCGPHWWHRMKRCAARVRSSVRARFSHSK